MNALRYRISSQDTIIEVNDPWVRFTIENGVPDLQPSQVLGQPLWRFISGVEVCHLYEMLLSRVRQRQETVVFPFRCDAPALRRFMEMRMTALPESEVEFVTRLVRTETRAPVLPPAPGCQCDQPSLKICSWCKRVQLAETEWVEVEEVVVRLGLFHLAVLPQFTHGVCKACYAAIMGALPAIPEEPNRETLGGERGTPNKGLEHRIGSENNFAT